MFCTLIGIRPNNLNICQRNLSGKTLEVAGVPLIWTDTFTVARDHDVPGSPLTLVMSVICKAPATPSDVVGEVKSLLLNALDDLSGDEKKFDFEAYGQGDVFKVECEEWASAPAPIPLAPINGYPYDFQVNDDEDAFGLSDEECLARKLIQQWGMFRVNNLLTSDQLREMRGLVNRSIKCIEEALEKFQPQVDVGRDNFLFKEIASRSLHRYDLRVERESEIGDMVNAFVWRHPKVQRYLSQTLTALDDIEYDISIVYSKPGALYQGWHADGNHVVGRPDAGWDELGYKHKLASSHAVCLFIPLIDLNEEVGFPQFWPGSHRFRNLVGFGKIAEVTESCWNGICKAGDSLWYDYRLMHRGMPNSSLDTLRPVLQIIFQERFHYEKRDYNFGTKSVYD